MDNYFLDNPEKLENLKKANDILHIGNSSLNKLIFVYSKPKVGSTCLVSSIRIFASNIFNIIHIHDEDMLQVLSGVKDVTVNELIAYNKHIGKEVYVIDVYRSPVEIKMSIFFEKIDSFHFNNTCEQLNNYNINKVINRFNKLFTYIATGDHFMDTYPIQVTPEFDYANKFLIVEQDGIKYIKLRLKDSSEWDGILTKILGTRIQIIKDYETVGKPIKELYLRFKEVYRIPSNYLTEISDCKYLNYYYSAQEKEEYIRSWETKMVAEDVVPFTIQEYKLYNQISSENCNFDTIQLKHYFDEGCLCKACHKKRNTVVYKILKGVELCPTEKINHEEAKHEFIEHKIQVLNKIQVINKIHNTKANRGFTKFTKLSGVYTKPGLTKINMKIL